MAEDKKLPADHDNWLVRAGTIRLLWAVLAGAFALSLAAELIWHPHPHFRIEALFGFGAWFGLAAALALVIFTKSFAIFVKRKDTYYD